MFSEAPGLPQNVEAYLSAVEEHYQEDAYNSLSIEGYEVSPALIDHVRNGLWNPAEESADIQQKDALAAKGFCQCYFEVYSLEILILDVFYLL